MIKLDIISGFLGAGKTTFVNKLLRHYMDNGLKPVCIVNEFGETGLDAQIIEADGFRAIEIDGGCICCTLKDDISVSLIEVIKTFSPTNIVFEPSGIFIFDNFFDILKIEELKNLCEVGSIITIVDSVNFAFSKAMFGSFIYNQIKNSPVIVLSKLEKTESKSADEMICDVKNVNANAIVIDKIWNDWNNDDFDLVLSRQGRVETEHRAKHHSFLKSETIEPSKPFTQECLSELIELCKSGKFGSICRIKGILEVDGKRILLNIAMQDITITDFRGPNPQTLTFIGDRIKKKRIAKFFEN